MNKVLRNLFIVSLLTSTAFADEVSYQSTKHVDSIDQV